MIKFLKKEKLFLLLFGLSIIIFLWDIILLKRIFLYGDYKQQFFPWSMEYAKAIKHFTLPLWVTDMGCGFPLVAEGQIGAFYPLNLLLFFILPPIAAYSSGAVLHFMLGGIFMYIFCKKIGLKNLSAIIPAILFMFASPYAGCFSNIASLKVLCWFPLVLCLMHVSLEKGKPSILLFPGIIMGLQLLAGAPQMALYSIAFSCLYFIFLIFSVERNQKINYFASFITSGLIALVIASPQIIATQTLVSLSNRGARGLSFALAKSFFPGGILTLVFPNMGGVFEGMMYIGILPLIFAAFAVFYAKKNSQIVFFIGMFLLSLLCAFGRYNPLYTAFLKATNFYLFRIPSKFLFFSAFSLIVLSGFGLQAVVADTDKTVRSKIGALSLTLLVVSALSLILGNAFLKIFKTGIIGFAKQYVANHFYNPALHRYPLQYYLNKIDMLHQSALDVITLSNKYNYMQLFILVISVILLIGYSGKHVKRNVLKGFIIFAIFFDLIFFSSIGWGFRGNLLKPSDVIKSNSTLEFLKKDKSLFRIYQFQQDEANDILQPNLNIYFGIDNIGVYSPLIFKRYSELLKGLACVDDSTGVGTTSVEALYRNLRLLGMLNIKYIVSPVNIEDKDLEFLRGSGNKGRIFLNKKVLPRAFIVHKAKIIKSDDKILSFMRSEEFNPAEIIVIEQEIPQDSFIGKMAHGEKTEASIEHYTERRVSIRTKSASGGFLVLSDYFYPGWQAYLDGRRVNILRADYILRAVYLPEGNHIVEFTYLKQR